MPPPQIDKELAKELKQIIEKQLANIEKLKESKKIDENLYQKLKKEFEIRISKAKEENGL